ncbi:MAG: SIS domain-containing protein [Bacteroidota bacterium]|nr:KpsF/GutQ family sugar-phosphate isomerase [Bacteroidota bacterium]
MKKESKIIKTAKETIRLQAQSIQELISFVDIGFEKVVQALFSCKGRIVVTGIGKSAIIAQKIVATFNSTGTPALFMHAADAVHGDMGMIQPNDVVLCISKSGESPEIKVLAPLIKQRGNKLVAITGNISSFLAGQSDYILNTTVRKEACPNNLAPTTSTTAQLVIGDALALCLLELRGFSASDFAKYHPGGALGKQLYLTVDELYLKNEMPFVYADTPLKEVILEISSKRLGATAVINTKGHLLGIITDGDLRRMMNKTFDMKKTTAKQIMTANPRHLELGKLAVEALTIMRSNNITQLPVVKKNTYLGMVHIHNLLDEGIV